MDSSEPQASGEVPAVVGRRTLASGDAVLLTGSRRSNDRWLFRRQSSALLHYIIDTLFASSRLCASVLNLQFGDEFRVMREYDKDILRFIVLTVSRALT
jgi:hypothetical protein